MNATSKYRAAKAPVYTRGIAPDSFLDELISWAKFAPDFVFAPNDKPDVYASVKAQLGPWNGLLHRKAAMLEVLRVLAGFESSWNWNEGRDITNSTSGTPETEETGIFQVSCNATNFDPSLKEFVIEWLGRRDCHLFITRMKTDHKVALGFAARLLRFTVRHNGPVLRKEINPWLSRLAVAEFESLLQVPDRTNGTDRTDVAGLSTLNSQLSTVQ